MKSTLFPTLRVGDQIQCKDNKEAVTLKMILGYEGFYSIIRRQTIIYIVEVNRGKNRPEKDR